MGLLGFVVDPNLVGLGEEFALSLRQPQRIQPDILPWVLLLVNLLVYVNTHDNQPSGADQEVPLFWSVLDKPYFINCTYLFIVDVHVRDLVMAQDQEWDSAQVGSETAHPEFVSRLGEDGDQVVLISMVTHDKVNTFIVLDFDEVNHLAGLLIEYSQVPLAVADDSQALECEDTGVLHAWFVVTELLSVCIQVEHFQLPTVWHHTAHAASAVNADVQPIVFVRVDETVDVSVVGRDVFHGRTFVYLVIILFACVNICNVKFLDFAVIRHNE